VNIKHLNKPNGLSCNELIDVVFEADLEDGSNWDVLECNDVEDAIEQLFDSSEIILEEKIDKMA
jgi:hypothetical protein